jgi:hypothetical protein
MKDIRLVPAGLYAYGAEQLAQGLWMLVSPGTFFTALGPFGARNDHYTRDVATWSLALGVVCLLVARRPSPARAAVLLLAGLQAALHTVNHVFDADLAHPGWVGVFDAVSLGLLAASLLGLWRLSTTPPPEVAS